MKIFVPTAFLSLPWLLPTVVECADKSPCEEESITLATCFIQTGAQCNDCFGNVTEAIIWAAASEGNECLAFNEWICPSSSCCKDGCQMEFNDYMQCVVDEATTEPCTLLCVDGAESGSDPQTPAPTPAPVKPDDSSKIEAPTRAPITFTFPPTSPNGFDGDDPCEEEVIAWESCIMNQANAASCTLCSEQYGTPSLADIFSGNYCRAWTSWTCPLVNCCNACSDRLETLFQCEINNDPLGEDCELDCANYEGSEGNNGIIGNGGSGCDVAANLFLSVCVTMIAVAVFGW